MTLAQSLRFGTLLDTPDRYPESLAVFLKQGSGWDLDQLSLAIDPDQAHDPDTEVGRLVAAEGWEYILEVSVVRQIIDNLATFIAHPTPEQRLAAFVHYFEHDSFWNPGVESQGEA